MIKSAGKTVKKKDYLPELTEHERSHCQVCASGKYEKIWGLPALKFSKAAYLHVYFSTKLSLCDVL